MYLTIQGWNRPLMDCGFLDPPAFQRRTESIGAFQILRRVEAFGAFGVLGVLEAVEVGCPCQRQT